MHRISAVYKNPSTKDLWTDWLDRYPLSWRIVLGVCLVLFCISLLPSISLALEKVTGKWLHIFFISWLSSLVLTSQAVWLALRFGAVDIPDKRKVHDRPTPRLGGMAVFFGILISFLLHVVPDVQLIVLFVGAGILFFSERPMIFSAFLQNCG